MASAYTQQDIETALLTAEGASRVDWLNKLVICIRGKEVRRALEVAETSMALAQSLNYEAGLAEATMQASNSSYLIGEYAAALHRGLHAEGLFRKQGDNTGVHHATRIIANIYLSTGDLSKAEHYFKESLQAAELCGDEKLIAAGHLNLGAMAYYNDDLDTALMHYERSFVIREKIGERFTMATVKANIAGIHQRRKNYEVATAMYREAIALGDAQDNRIASVVAMSNLGNLYAEQERYPDAIQTLHDAIARIDDTVPKRHLLDTYTMLKDAYKKSGDFEKALQTLETFLEIREKLLGTEVEQKIKVVETDAEQIRAKQADELRAAEARIKTLEEIVTVCAWSGKIKHDDTWVSIEEFLVKRFGFQVSHGISDEEYKKFLDGKLPNSQIEK
jgi:tetratricopeptide (TPR) repeat protein